MAPVSISRPNRTRRYFSGEGRTISSPVAIINMVPGRGFAPTPGSESCRLHWAIWTTKKICQIGFGERVDGGVGRDHEMRTPRAAKKRKKGGARPDSRRGMGSAPRRGSGETGRGGNVSEPHRWTGNPVHPRSDQDQGRDTVREVDWILGKGSRRCRPGRRHQRCHRH